MKRLWRRLATCCRMVLLLHFSTPFVYSSLKASTPRSISGGRKTLRRSQSGSTSMTRATSERSENVESFHNVLTVVNRKRAVMLISRASYHRRGKPMLTRVATKLPFFWFQVLVLALGAVPLVADDDGGDDGTKFFGVVQSLPSGGLVGNWQVGGSTVQVSISTEIDQENGAAAVGACVEVEGSLLA